jgi:hypothetical protein
MAISLKNFIRGLRLKPDNVALPAKEGSLKVELSSATFQAYLGGAVRSIVTTDQTQTLTNKSIDGSDNTITNIPTSALPSSIDATKIADGSVSNTEFQYLDGVTSSIQTQLNTGATNLANHIADPTDAHAASAITNTPAGTIAATTVQGAVNELDGDIQGHITNTTGAHAATAISATPFNTIAGTNVQTQLQQIDARITSAGAGNVQGPASSTDNAVARFDQTTGKIIQNSVVTISDSGIMLGLAGLNSSGQATFVDTLTQGVIREGIVDDNATGSNQAITALGSSIVRLTNSGLVSVSELSSQDVGAVYTIINATGNSVTIKNNAIAGTGIKTGTKADITLADEASLIVKYDNIENAWMVIGGTGAGTGGSLAEIFQLNGTDVATWTTGDNATFLGGGTLSGTFVANTSTPLQGVSSYQYTQAAGSLDDYAASAVQAVAPRFRGTNVTLSFPYTYTGTSSDIQVVVYCATTSTILTQGALLPASTTNAIFRTNCYIPATCTGVRFGFHVKSLSSGAVFSFDSVVLSSDTTVYSGMATNQTWKSFTPTGSWTTNTTYSGRWRQNGENADIDVTLTLTGAPNAVNLTVNLPAGLTMDTTKMSDSSMFNKGFGSIQIRDVSGNFWEGGIRYNTATSFIFTISNSNIISATLPFTFASGDTLSFQTSVPVVGLSAFSQNILTAPDTFSTDTNALTYASSAQYTSTTLANAPIGTFITYTQNASSNARTQTTTAPSQSTTDMAANGIRIFPRPYGSTSTAGNPAIVEIQIGKGLKGVNLTTYANTGKTAAGDVDYFLKGTTEAYGFRSHSYNPVTGILTLDAGTTESTVTIAGFVFSNGSSSTNGYVTIEASKNPALTGLNISAVAARAVNTSGTSIPNATGVAFTYDATKTYDTHGALNAASGSYVAPEAGYYTVNAAYSTAVVAWSTGNFAQLYITKNGTTVSSSLYVIQAAGSYNPNVTINDQIYLAKGDVLAIGIYISRGAATSLASASTFNYFAISKTSVG